MAVIKYKDSAGNWKDLIYAEGGEGGGGSAQAVIVTVNGDRASRDGKQIAASAAAGYAVYIKPYAEQEFFVALSHFNKDDVAFFSYVNTEEAISYCCMVDSDGAFEAFENSYITGSYFNAMVGDIDAVLDSIIAIQNNLIGGDGV